MCSGRVPRAIVCVARNWLSLARSVTIDPTCDRGDDSTGRQNGERVEADLHGTGARSGDSSRTTGAAKCWGRNAATGFQATPDETKASAYSSLFTFFPALLVLGAVLATLSRGQVYLREISYALGTILPAGSSTVLAYLRGSTQTGRLACSSPPHC